MDNYNDIINLPYKKSLKHKHMSLEQRSAQFAPFAALTGYEGQIKETARLTTKKIELDEEMKLILDTKIQILIENVNLKPLTEITYFIEDKKKDGGEYVTILNQIKKIDNYKQEILTEEGLKISILDIIDIDCELFKNIVF